MCFQFADYQYSSSATISHGFVSAPRSGRSSSQWRKDSEQQGERVTRRRCESTELILWYLYVYVCICDFHWQIAFSCCFLNRCMYLLKATNLPIVNMCNWFGEQKTGKTLANVFCLRKKWRFEIERDCETILKHICTLLQHHPSRICPSQQSVNAESSKTASGVWLTRRGNFEESVSLTLTTLS